MGKNTSISLGNNFESFIEHAISKVRFSNVSEVINAGLCLLEEESRITVFKIAIPEGINESIAEHFDSKNHLDAPKARKIYD